MDFKIIQSTPIFNALSSLGKEISLPDGIFYWAGRAKKEAEILGTIGAAFGFEKDFIDGGSENWVPCYLDGIKEYSSLNISNIVPYASIGGVNELRDLWKTWIIEKSGYSKSSDKDKIDFLNKNISKPIITNGVTNGIFLAASLFLNPNESIICPNKRWGNYDLIIEKRIGAKIESFQFFENNRINLEGLKDSIEKIGNFQDKVVIILNFPNNPTGYVPKIDEADALISLFKKTQEKLRKPFIIIVDDAYEPYVYENNMLTHSIFYKLQQLKQDIIPVKLDGITKELLMYGGRIGFLTIGLKPSWVPNDEELNKLKNELHNKLKGMNRSTISNCNHFYQQLTIELFKDEGIEGIIEKRDKVKNLLERRYRIINEELKKIKDPDITIDPNSGGFFLFLNLNKDKIKATEFADHLLRNYKIGVIPIQKPQEDINGIRIAYCSIDIKDIPEFTKRIEQALKDF
ncbi:MAG: aminotransferase class I/II-fold pyridoxal phosphate-dependent enzyme [Candidatus Lokiarchaeota archaeon]|nr:aminotransferase class I/II-fold pyridoxal phosphate-dependent enzyme [Candidatus Lokiarchaeota archaeon]MBD3199387.1 aminotransferase class I/II-fold pyridoxal phosphate-dependent enzyme [Candidatus Lokiarchaeota archaeon]